MDRKFLAGSIWIVYDLFYDLKFSQFTRRFNLIIVIDDVKQWKSNYTNKRSFNFNNLQNFSAIG